MQKQFLSLLLIFIAVSNLGYSNTTSYSRMHLGFGVGMDYGGIGLKAELLPIRQVGVFVGVGYNTLSLGLNGGVRFRPLEGKKIQPLLTGMYGYNGVINIRGMSGVSKTYFGFSLGLGGELSIGARGNRLYAGVIYPFRTSAFEDDYNWVKQHPAIKMDNELLPVTFSVGFNWLL